MQLSLPQRLRRRAQAETRLVEPNQGGRLRIVLTYPNTYVVGMSNLGVQTIYRLLNDHPEVCCERAFLPDPEDLELHRQRGTPLLTIESQRPVADAGVIAFSASFENDYPNLLTLLGLAGLPLRAANRDARHPLVVMGGATVSINPEPVAPFLDVCCVGEGEDIVGPLIEAVLEAAGGSRKELLERLARLPGFYVPSLYEPRYADCDPHTGVPRFAGLQAAEGVPHTVSKVRAHFGGVDSVAATSIMTPEGEFADRALIEVARGCTKGCRYCWVGYNILPFRVHAVDDILAVAERWRGSTKRVGLVATALLDHPDIEAIARGLRERDFEVFSPSLIISTLRQPLLDCLIESGQRSITVAPETGSDRLRELIMKKITNAEILEKVRMIFRAGAVNLKNYVIVGLPGEEEQDLQDLVDLAAGMREVMIEEGRAKGRVGTITLSVNCLIPKPGTPFQWVEQIRPRDYRAKLKWLQQRISKLPNVVVESMSPRAAEMQAVLSRGDRRVADLLEHLVDTGSWRPAVRAWEAEGGCLDHFAYRAYEPGEPLPWEHLRTGASPTALENQWNKARATAVEMAV